MNHDADDDRLVELYRECRQRIQGLLLDAGDPDAAVPACPEWRARDLVAHVTALASDLSTGKGPTGDTQAWVDAQVADRRTTDPARLVAEWSTSGPAFEALIAAKPYRWWGLVYDELVHEHDLRGALDRPGERNGEAVTVAARLGLRLVALDLAKQELPAFRAVLDGQEHIVGDGDVGLTLETSSFEALRLLGSRRTIEELRSAPFTGDLDRYLPGIVHMELPVVAVAE